MMKENKVSENLGVYIVWLVLLVIGGLVLLYGPYVGIGIFFTLMTICLVADKGWFGVIMALVFGGITFLLSLVFSPYLGLAFVFLTTLSVCMEDESKTDKEIEVPTT